MGRVSLGWLRRFARRAFYGTEGWGAIAEPADTKRRARGAALAQVGPECEAYLSGSYQEYLEGQHLPVPAWAWMNPLAHGSLDDVRRLDGTSAPDTHPQAYVVRLANHVLVRTGNEREALERFQLEELIPLELALAASPRPLIPADAADLSRAVVQRSAAGVEPIHAASKDPGPEP